MTKSNALNVRKMLADIYLEFRNDYLTVEKYAEHKGIHKNHMQDLIDLARIVAVTQHPES